VEQYVSCIEQIIIIIIIIKTKAAEEEKDNVDDDKNLRLLSVMVMPCDESLKCASVVVTPVDLSNSKVTLTARSIAGGPVNDSTSTVLM